MITFNQAVYRSSVLGVTYCVDWDHLRFLTSKNFSGQDKTVIDYLTSLQPCLTKLPAIKPSLKFPKVWGGFTLFPVTGIGCEPGYQRFGSGKCIKMPKPGGIAPGQMPGTMTEPDPGFDIKKLLIPAALLAAAYFLLS